MDLSVVNSVWIGAAGLCVFHPPVPTVRSRPSELPAKGCSTDMEHPRLPPQTLV